MKIAIDLSLRSTGISVFKSDTLIDFTICSNHTLKDEELITYNCNYICDYIQKQCLKPSLIRIEGLSFGSISGSKDMIAGQFWVLRCELKKMFPGTVIEIISVKSWRCPLFTKEENKELSEAKKIFKAEKKEIKGLKGVERNEARAINVQLELNASIKERTWEKLDIETQNKIVEFLKLNNYDFNSRYDICDSIFLGKYIHVEVIKKKSKKK